MSETIWSNSKSNNYRNVLDQFDPIGAGSNDLVSSHLSLDGSDMDSSRFDLKSGALSAITAPVGGYQPTSSPNQGQRLGLGTASITGGIASRHPPQDSFLQKFSGVGDATRDLELSGSFAKLDLEPTSRRTSFNHQEFKGFGDNYSSPTGSLNENLNINRTSRHQSISEKIDHYNNTSPIQASATLSMNSEPKDDRGGNNIWNPSAAAFNPQGAAFNVQGGTGFGPQGAFNPQVNGFNPQAAPGGPAGAGPGPEAYSMGGMIPPQFNPYGRTNPISPPPFMVPSPGMFMDPRMYNMSYGNGTAFGGAFGEPTESNNSSVNSSNDSTEETVKEDTAKDGSPRKDYVHTPGIGMPRQVPGRFMFNPYGVYQQSPPLMNVVLQSEPEPEKTKKFSPPSEPQSPPISAGNGNGGGRKKNGKANGKGAPHIYRSPLLEEVRSNFKGKEYFLKDIYGHAIEFTKDQHGSRFIQQKLPDASEEEKEVIFNEIRGICYELMTDVFGNYVIQKFFEHGTRTQKLVLLDNMLGHIYELSLQMYGCRVVQRALEAIEVDGQVKIITELQNHVLICAKDQNGNHVIQKSVERIPFEKVRFILDSLENQIYHLSTHPYGCRVIQRLLEHSTEEDQQKILGELNRFIFYLIQDQYGNYVMQHILERGKPDDREAILKIVLGSVVTFSKHKFASNVIEKCIKFGSDQQRRRILHEVLLHNEDLSIETVGDDSPLALMMKDQYANYVIQKLVEGFSTKSEEKKLLVMKLRQYLKQISSKNSYGKHLASVEKMIIVAETALEADN